MASTREPLNAAARPAWNWFFLMAWRDSRRSRRRLLLFSCSIVLGIAAMVAIGSFGKNLEQAVAQQTKALLGADLMVQSRDPFNDRQRAALDGLGDAQSEQTLFSSMAFFPKGQGTRLAQVVGLNGDFPFYGAVETEPAAGWEKYRRGEGALVEATMMQQFGVQVGDEVRIGKLTVPVVGALLKVPGDNEMFASLAPRVFLRMEQLPATGLLGEASLARYRRFVRFPSDAALQTAVAKLRAIGEKEPLGLRLDTVDERRENLGDSMANLHRFLNLAGFIALLLGSIGIASAIQVHVRQRLDSVALLRCLGATARQAFAIYLIQGAALGLAGVATGSVLGIALQQILPRAFADMLPMQVSLALDLSSVLRAAGIGFGICLLFALLPLLQVRTVAPLAVFRRDYETTTRRDPWFFIVCGIIALAVAGFAITQTKQLRQGLGFAGGLAVAWLSLLGVARLVVWGVRRLNRPSWPFVWKQGLASLHRPHNRTLLLMVSLGLGTFLILTMHLVRHSLVTELAPAAQGDKPNTILFDVQTDQRAGVAEVLKQQGLPLFDSSPVVTMRIQSVKGVPASELIKTRDRSDRWSLRREYRSTYRDHLANSEQLISGQWIKNSSATNDVVPISLEEGISKDLRVGVGDEMVFDIQGVPMKTRVANLRRVDWRRMQANFFVVFPAGVLEDAPGFHILTTRVRDAAQSAALQRAVVQKHPNVSTIDFTVVLRVIEGVVEKISFAIQFMALFTVLTGVILLVTAVLNTRFQRLRESVLLRTLGASSGQLQQLQILEFSLLGFLASLTGIVLAVGAQWALTKFVFKIGFSLPVGQLALAVVVNVALTVVVGLLSSRLVLRRPPLEILRAEG